MVDRTAFTWSTSCLDFWANSGPNREGDTSSKLESSSTKGSRALFICVITLVRLIRALALPRSLIAAAAAARVCSDALLCFNDGTKCGEGIKYVHLNHCQLLISGHGSCRDLWFQIIVQLGSLGCRHLRERISISYL